MPHPILDDLSLPSEPIPCPKDLFIEGDDDDLIEIQDLLDELGLEEPAFIGGRRA